MSAEGRISSDSVDTQSITAASPQAYPASPQTLGDLGAGNLWVGACMGPAAATQTPSSLGHSFPYGSTLKKWSLHIVFTGKAERKGWRPRSRGLPPLPSTQGRRLLTLFHRGWGWLRCGAVAWVFLLRAATPAPPQAPSLPGLGAAAVQAQGSGISAGSDRGLGGQSPVWACQAAPQLRALGRDHREQGEDAGWMDAMRGQ